MAKDTLRFGPNYTISAVDKTGSASNPNGVLPSSQYSIPLDVTGMQIEMSSSGGGGGGGACAIYDGPFVYKEMRAGGGGGSSGNALTFKTGRYIPFFYVTDGNILNVVTLDSRILKLDSIRLGAGGAGKPRAYSYASPTQGGGSATATASSGNSANSTYMDLKHDANTWIRFETYGGRGGGGADCHAELNSDHANYGNGAYAGSLGAIQISIEGRSYQSQIIPPASSGNNMIISLDGYGNVSSDWTSSDGRASLKFTTSSIKLSTIDESTYLEIYWTPEFGRKGSNGDSSGGGGTSGSYLNGRFGGIGGNYNSSSANGTSDAYVYWDVYRDSLDVTVISAIDYNTSTVTYSKPTKFPQIRYDGQWKTIKGGSVWDGTNWKRIGGNLYSYSTGTFY